MGRSTIRDKIIPHAVSWFTGEAIQSDEFGDLEDEEEEEDIDEEEDEDEDEEDEDEDDEEEDVKKTKKKPSHKVIVIPSLQTIVNSAGSRFSLC